MKQKESGLYYRILGSPANSPIRSCELVEPSDRSGGYPGDFQCLGRSALCGSDGTAGVDQD